MIFSNTYTDAFVSKTRLVAASEIVMFILNTGRFALPGETAENHGSAVRGLNTIDSVLWTPFCASLSGALTYSIRKDDYISGFKSGIVSGLAYCHALLRPHDTDNRDSTVVFPTNCIYEFVQRVLVQFKSAVVKAVLKVCPLGGRCVPAAHLFYDSCGSSFEKRKTA